jgi:hypothetical protein
VTVTGDAVGEVRTSSPERRTTARRPAAVMCKVPSEDLEKAPGWRAAVGVRAALDAGARSAASWPRTLRLGSRDDTASTSGPVPRLPTSSASAATATTPGDAIGRTGEVVVI